MERAWFLFANKLKPKQELQKMALIWDQSS